ncbi:DUF333 domain-containing protein [Proteus mirabilis]|uniref:putative hemolysin n=1 Tax=Proteus mirabilis TaxID=584 RepID=UPI0004004321|nr:DUF333 domain-containing protein [Proteus mirabilis]AVA40314.1 DUF333 domain-containing protein [Proteus mirabilis]AZH05063.1 DUF333 domain-containing protein [Proteus mirabilis]EJD6328959.1 DUF333 domain-containing protein [Proteus mirabilis]EJD6390808.1 DUF333 domain-containing protein [Proteus mirabilis]EKT9733106.1 DUF333 domain-containing protein [Proteus mirabilis]
MQRKMKTTCFLLMLTSFALLTGCSQSKQAQNTTAQVINSNKTIATTPSIPLEEPAKETCIFSGGVPALTYELHGGQTPVCQFANGKRCSEQALIDGACIPG